jgi:hypothetical protein
LKTNPPPPPYIYWNISFKHVFFVTENNNTEKENIYPAKIF